MCSFPPRYQVRSPDPAPANSGSMGNSAAYTGDDSDDAWGHAVVYVPDAARSSWTPLSPPRKTVRGVVVTRPAFAVNHATISDALPPMALSKYGLQPWVSTRTSRKKKIASVFGPR